MALNLQIDTAVNGAAQSVKDQNGNTSSLTVAADKIGVGTRDPQGKLDVSGNIVLNGNPKTQLSATRDTTVVKGSPIVLDLSPWGGGQLHLGNNTMITASTLKASTVMAADMPQRCSSLAAMRRACHCSRS